MKKRTLVLLLCIALVTLVAVNDTLANEVQGLFSNLTQWLGDTLGKPAVNTAQLDVEIVSSTTGVLTPAHYSGDFSWSKAGNAVVHKNTCVKNLQQEAAYVRISIAVKNADCLKMQLQDVPADYVMVTRSIQINGEPFTLCTFDYTKALAKDKKTPDLVMDFALTKETNNDDLAALGNQFVQVQSFAIQASAFQQLDENGNKIGKDDVVTQPMTPATALKTALGTIETFNPFQ